MVRIKCATCSHSKITIIRPIISNLHEYEDSFNGAPSLMGSEDYFDYIFYYDLTRLALRALQNVHANENFSDHLVEKCHCSTSFMQNFFKESEDYFGRFGEYHIEPVMREKDLGGQILKASYQEIDYEVIELSQTFQKLSKKKKMLIQYAEPSASVIETSMLQSDEITIVTLIVSLWTLFESRRSLSWIVFIHSNHLL